MTLAGEVEITTEDMNGSLLVMVKGPLTIYEVGSVHETLTAGFGSNRGLVLDLSGVTECDTAGVQLLCSGKQTAEGKGKDFGVAGLAPAVLKAFDSCGLSPEKVFDPKEEI